MSAPTEVQLNILCIVLIVLFHGLYTFRHQWNFPLRNGPGFFLGVQVPPDFYEGPGIRWLKSYRAMLIALSGIVALALVAIVLTGRWDMTGAWAGGTAIVIVAPMMGFVAWTRHRLGANPPVLPGVAIALERRRLSNYISWPMEILMAVVLGASWLSLFFRGSVHVDWQYPTMITWIALGMLPGKIILVRNNPPLPPEHTEEHYRLSEATRRWSLRQMDVFRWGVVVTLALYALKHSWAAAQGIAWLSWTFIGIALAPWLVLAAVLIRGQMRLTAMGRDLRPAGSWSTPFRPARLMLPGGLIWFAIWFGGLMLLLILFHG
jgi:hypothetical protein